jgi:hypothetical protein
MRCDIAMCAFFNQAISLGLVISIRQLWLMSLFSMTTCSSIEEDGEIAIEFYMVVLLSG